MKYPNLTIGLPVYNDSKHLKESIESILNQTYHDFILIISDDCSTDGSELICKEYVNKDSRIKYIRQKKNLGISRNMQFLLNISTTKYFMWAGDDDVLHPEFCETIISKLDNSNAISAFCSFNYIDDNGKVISPTIDFDYTEKNTFKRLKKFIKNSNDIMGYGIFKRDFIKEVKFPIWWWPNKNTPLNNIYPTICFYLAKGEYIHVYSNNALFSKRIKSTSNYPIGQSNALFETVAFIIRRFNLIVISFIQILKATYFLNAVRCLTYLIIYWFFIPVLNQLKIIWKRSLQKLKLKRF